MSVDNSPSIKDGIPQTVECCESNEKSKDDKETSTLTLFSSNINKRENIFR